MKKDNRERAPVEIREYDAIWPAKFEKQRIDIVNSIGNKVVAIEHIGSTAVPGLGAKPIIDIMVGLRRLSDAEDCIEPLQRIGYEYVPELEAQIPERRYFHKGPSNVPEKHYHLHMVEIHGEFWNVQILFRDYLRTHSDSAREYSKLKKDLAAKYRFDREAYTEAKTSFIKSIIAKARVDQSITMKKTVKTDFQTDDLKAIKIAGRLFTEFYNRRGFFIDYSMPEYVLPRSLKEGSKEHALFLTYVISIDYMTDAVKLWKRSRGAYPLHPDMFTPKQILKVNPTTVENFVKKLGARYYTNAAKTWIKISKVFTDKYDEDPRNLTKEPLMIADVKQKLKDFPYLRGNKLTNFYIRAMAETGLLKVKDFEDLDIPVDKQVARFTIYSGVLKLLSEQFVGCAQEQPLRGLIEEAWRHAAKTLGTAPWKLDEPIWTVGSKLCSERKCGKCPVDGLCDKTKGITFKENTVVWNRK